MRSTRFRSATSTLAPLSCSPYSISSVVHHPLRPTRMAPCCTAAQNVRHHSGLFWDSTATRSPLRTPKRSRRAWATPLAVWTKVVKP